MGGFNNPLDLDKTDLTGITFKATVIDNDDSNHPDGQQLGRVKFKINLLHESVNDENLPWAIPNVSRAIGPAPNSGSWSIPVKDSSIYITFQEGSHYFPMYEGGSWDKSNMPQLLIDNYPNSYGIVDPSGNKIWVTYSEGASTINVEHKSTTKLVINDAGDLDVTVVGKTTINSTGDATIHSDGKTTVNSTGDMLVESSGNTKVKAATKATIDAPQVEISTGALDNLVTKTFLTMFDAHTHTTTSPGSPTSPPLIPASPIPANATINTKAA